LPCVDPISVRANRCEPRSFHPPLRDHPTNTLLNAARLGALVLTASLATACASLPGGGEPSVSPRHATLKAAEKVEPVLDELTNLAIHDAGYAMRAHSAGDKVVNGVRHRLELEDMFTGTLIAAGHSSLRAIQQNDQARDRLAEQLWDSLHQKHVILRKVRKHPQ